MVLMIPQEPPVAAINFINPEINFKRVSDGWVFRAPNPWILGESPHYLVSDDHRVRIIAALRTMGAVLPLVVIIASMVSVSLAVFWELDDIGVAFLVVVLIPLVISGLAAIQRESLKPILADASLTNERITFAEMRKADEDSTPAEQARWRWMLSTLLCVIAAAIAISNWARPAKGTFFAILWVFYAWHAIRWYRVSKRRTKQER
jgi:hypothetical protein